MLLQAKAASAATARERAQLYAEQSRQPVSNIEDDVALLSSPAWTSPSIDWAVAHSIEGGVRAPFSLPEQTQRHTFTMEDFRILEQGLALHWSEKGAAQLELIKHQLGLP